MARSKLALVTIILIVGALLMQLHAERTAPRLSGVVCHPEGGNSYECSLPLRVRSENPLLMLDATLHLPEQFPSLFHVRAHGCLNALLINGEALPQAAFCFEPLGRQVDLSQYLQSGENQISVRLKNENADLIVHEFDLKVSTMDTFILSQTALLLLLLLGCLAIIIRGRCRVGAFPCSLGIVVLGGVLLRVLYLLSTPYAVRVYDWQHHLQYIQYVSQHLQIPAASLGWETYQPPLYYMFSTLWMKIGEGLGRSYEFLLSDLQVGALLLSLAVLGISAWISSMLFTSKKDRLLFLGVIATFPGVIFFSSRISNDVLLALFGFLFLGFLIRWWQEGREFDFHRAAVALSLGVLTKSNALLLLPVLYLCLFLKKGVTNTKKLVSVSLILILLITGWYFALRFIIEGERSLIGNIDRHPPETLMQDAREPLQFVTFNPSRVLAQPYNNQWEDSSGRKHFFEYFIRSAFAGDFHFGDQLAILITLLLFVTMILVPYFLRGLLRAREQIPLITTFIVLLLGHMAFRWILPQATVQDFRFSVLLIIPILYFTIQGMEKVPAWARMIAQAALFSLIVLSTVLILGLYVSG
jgi:hypothetical protein